MVPFPPMPGPGDGGTPIGPQNLSGILTDRDGNFIAADTSVLAYDETNIGDHTDPVKTNGKIVMALQNVSDWAFNDRVRMQCIDDEGNGEVWYVSPQSGTGFTSITKTIRAINPVCDRRFDKFPTRSVVKT